MKIVYAEIMGRTMRCEVVPNLAFGIYGGYEIALSNGRGGKAGTGCNKTATIHVREPVRPGEYLLKAQFRYTVASSASKANAHAKARAWIDANTPPITDRETMT